ncbi:MAG: phosphoribosylformylglycinamidine synthase subunit PurL [Flavobacteriales bacterium]|nr:phosphoribosylformylglycinamidine synthase subunit PurL [Flavobacteriales bacterium]
MDNTTTNQLTTVETAGKLGLRPEEFEKIKGILGRTPNFTELSIFSVMWSEHCSYKNSIKWLKTLPRTGSKMLVEAGAENAGLVDIGDGLACAFKIESHNHPSALEPYQGAATGVGGINRDIFTMGARPIAQLNSLRFGNPDLDKTKWLVKGVVKGIGDYGNSFGIPTVGGEVFFDECYNQNPLVNAMSVGTLEVGTMVSATSHGVGNPVFIVGSSTGKDGIHGATFASGDITEDSAEDLPAVQVGDPFQEKLLLEASLEVIKTGAVIGMQDMGAAGITCSTSEMSDKGGHGMDIWLDKVPTRQQNMLGWEILLSESQERMLIVVEKGREEEVLAVFDKWDLNCVEIGVVTEPNRGEKGGTLRYYMNGELEAQVPAWDLVLGGGAPVYDREYSEPAYYAEYQKFNIDQLSEPESLKDASWHLIGHLNIASKNWVTEQYDSMVGTLNMSTNSPSDAAVVNLKDSNRALAMTVDCNSRYVNADPEKGTQIAVAEAARNLICTGAEPTGVTNCLNFGNPYQPEVFWQFVGAIKGMGAACRKFDTPVTGGNVSFYNQSVYKDRTEPVFPTPTIGMVGILGDKSDRMTLDFKTAGDLIYLVGTSRNDVNSSEYLYSFRGVKGSPAPFIDLEEEYAVQQLILALIKERIVQSVHDVSDGGLFITVLESALPKGFGFEFESDSEIRTDAFLFGESQSRAVVSIKPEAQDEFVELMSASGVDYTLLGTVTSDDKMVIDGEEFGKVSEAKKTYNSVLANKMA